MSKGKKWSGMFSKNISEKMAIFNSSISFDYVLLKYDIIGTFAHIKMLKKIGILNDDELKKIQNELTEIQNKLDNGQLEIDFESEDVHFFLQSKLAEKIGDLAKKVHTGRSRNDQVALDLRLFARDKVQNITTLIELLTKELLRIASDNLNTLMPSYTHLQKAQPTSLAHYLTSYAECLIEDISRLKDLHKRINVCPLGSSSVCGSCLPLDRDFVAEEMAFSGLIHNSMNAVSNRDFIIEFCSTTGIIMSHLSRLCEDIIIYSSEEFGFFILDDAFCTGSSLMPNKKNPDLPELIRGKSARAVGNVMSIFAIMKGLPSSYNKDMQEDKKSMFENSEIVEQCLEILTGFISTLQFNTRKMLDSVVNSYSLATDILDYLVQKDIPFKDGHEIVAKLTKHCTESNLLFHQLSIQTFKEFSPFFADDVFAILSPSTILSNHETYGSPNPKMMVKLIDNLEKKLYEKS